MRVNRAVIACEEGECECLRRVEDGQTERSPKAARQGDEAHAEAICCNLRLRYCQDIDGRASKSDISRSRIPTPLPARSVMSTAMFALASSR